jgi:hypothetical protein
MDSRKGDSPLGRNNQRSVLNNLCISNQVDLSVRKAALDIGN